MATFDHERLNVYQTSLEFITLVEELVKTFPSGHADVIDQLRRASVSIVLNTAEGAGEFSRKEKARFYRMARRSGTECAGVLDICRCRKIIDENQAMPGKTLLLRIVSMLVGLIRRVDTSSKGLDKEKRSVGSDNTGQGQGQGQGQGM